MSIHVEASSGRFTHRPRLPPHRLFVVLSSVSVYIFIFRNSPPASTMERTYIMIKPDGVQRGLIGEIIKRFEQKGYKLIAMKLTSPGQGHMEKHYEDLAGKKFFPGLISYMTSGPVCECITHVLSLGE